MAIEKPGTAKQHAEDKLNLHLVFDESSSVSHLREHIERLNRLASLGTLAASMAHEIKNALVAGKTFIDLLLENNQDAELAQVVRRELGRIDLMVSRMLRFARPGEFRSHKVHLHEILDHSLRLVEPLMEAKPVSVTRSLVAVEDVVDGDEHELQQAFVNLLLNAVEAVGPNGKITVTTNLARAAVEVPTHSSGQLQVTIHDTGIGIAPENMTRLFEPFFTTKPTGTGLGLAITRRILQQHRGEISAKSPPGEGTTFTILLPAIAEVGH
jgi:two-component system sensor histidine kinase HydH